MIHKFETEESRQTFARQIAQEAMVLLKNEDNVLPLQTGQTVALVGRTQLHTIIGGSGSGASHSKGTLEIREELPNAGLSLASAMEKFYTDLAQKELEKAATDRDPDEGSGEGGFWKKIEGLVASGLIYEIFGKYTPAVPEEIPGTEAFCAAQTETDTAIFLLGRATGGEECDRRVEDDYLLTASEQALLAETCRHFPKVIAVLNVNGMIDLPAFDAYPEVKAILFMGTAGEQAAGALADILTGRVSPSGKLNQTAALAYEDYPTAAHFSSNKDLPQSIRTYEDYGLSPEDNGSCGFTMSPVTVYAEDIYMGYRYFDSFEKPVAYPFGFGLSYAAFAVLPMHTEVTGGRFTADVCVKNISDQYAGKEAVQLYVHAPFGKLKKPEKELRAFTKTPELAPGQECLVTLSFPLTALASFGEADNAWIVEAGKYTVLLGNSSRDVSSCAVIEVPETVVTKKVTADIGIRPENKDKIQLIEPKKEILQDLQKEKAVGNPVRILRVSAADFCEERYEAAVYDFTKTAIQSKISDVKDGRVTMEEFVNQLSVRELAVLLNGYGPGLPFGGIAAKDKTPTIEDEEGKPIGTTTRPELGFGYVNPAIEKYGITSAYYKDGPASVGKTAWPTGMMLACTFNPALAYEMGSACGYEAESIGVDSWLTPGMNLVRNPIEGRAFEYYGEDPFLSGTMGVQVTCGAMENNAVTTCPKHFALNEQETYRRGSEKKKIDAVDSIVSARAVRELYLKPFEMVITKGRPTTIMSSFNKINGTFAAGNHVLCTEILRGEWGFDGAVVTDWGDMDQVVDGADAIHAGNDVIMPGGPPVIRQVLQGYEEGRVTLQEMRLAAAHLLNHLLHCKDHT